MVRVLACTVVVVVKDQLNLFQVKHSPFTKSKHGHVSTVLMCFNTTVVFYHYYFQLHNLNLSILSTLITDFCTYMSEGGGGVAVNVILTRSSGSGASQGT